MLSRLFYTILMTVITIVLYYSHARATTMNHYEKLEWIHSQVQEIQNGIEIDFDLMYEFIEDVREYLHNCYHDCS